MNVSTLDQAFRLNPRPRAWKPAPTLCALAIAVFAQAQAQPEPGTLPSAMTPAEFGELRSLDIAALKRTYLDCDRAASERALAFVEAVACSQVSEALLQRGFGGDFTRLLAWWRDEKARREEAQVGLR